jgi:hypothetical protein
MLGAAGKRVGSTFPSVRISAETFAEPTFIWSAVSAQSHGGWRAGLWILTFVRMTEEVGLGLLV